MAERTGILVGAGDFTDRGLGGPLGETRGGDSLIIAADGGLRHLESVGLAPDLIVGDFDSLGYVPASSPSDTAKSREAGRKPAAPEIVCLPVEKDDTDMAEACRIAWDAGCRKLLLYGASGDRPDHFLANLQLAAFYSRQGGDVQLIAPAYTVYAVTDGSLRLTAEKGVTFSVFCHGDTAEGVSIGGDVKYRIRDARLTNTRALGVSNLMTGEEAQISVRSGTLLVFLYCRRFPEAAE